MDEKSNLQEIEAKTLHKIKATFDEISTIKEPITRDYLLIQTAKSLGFTVEEYRLMFQSYLHQKKGLWLNKPWARPITLMEEFVENITYWLEKWDFIKLLDYASKITIIIGFFTFINQLFKADERVRIERVKAQYEAWQVINSAAGQGGSGGRIDALQSLNKDRISLARLTVEGANLTGINLQHAKLQGANFRNANLSEANLSYADLQGANLSGANLDGASLDKANLRGADLTSANLSTASFQEAFYDKTTKLDASDLLKISGALNLSSLVRANLQNEKRLKGAPLEGLNLADVNFQRADLQEANLARSNLKNANLQEANLQGAVLSFTGFQASDLRGANLNKVKTEPFFFYNNLTKFPDKFDTSKGINLNDSIIEGGSLTWNDALYDGTRIPTSSLFIKNIKRMAFQLENAQKEIGSPLKIVSWYRPTDVNRALGGKSDSAHLQGLQVMFIVEGYTCQQVIEQINNWVGELKCNFPVPEVVNANILEPFPRENDSEKP